jgi:amino acid transporter
MQEALPPLPAATQDDDARLRGLGYRPRLSRVLGLFANFSVAFTFMAPVIGIFTMFTLGLSTAGPAYLWLTFIPVAGLLLVAVVLGQLARQYPAAGALYQYAKYTAGPKTGWFTGWFYGIALLLTVAAVDAGAVSYVSAFVHDVFGQTFTPSQHSVILVIALGLLVIQTTLNTLGVRATRVIALLGVLAGLLGTFGFAIVLAVHGFHHGIGFLTSTQDVQHAASNPLGVSFGGSWIAGALVALIAPVYIFRGFQTPGDLAEETLNPGRQVPRAMRLALIVGGIGAFVLTGALLLAMPGGAGTVVKTVQSGGIPYILATLPSGLQETMLGLIVLAFFAAGAAVQAAGSRLIFSYARDGALPGGKSLAEVSERFRTPANALFAGMLVTVVFVGLEFASTSQNVKILWFSYPGGGNVLTSLATFAVTGLYLALLLTVVGSMIARARGRLAPARWAWPVSVVAALYLVLMLADLIVPTGLASARAYFNQDWITLMVMLAIAVIGLVVFLIARRGYRAGEQPPDEAVAGITEAGAGEPVPVPVPGTAAEAGTETETEAAGDLADPGAEAP